MNAGLLNLLLWIPFVLVFVVALVLFLVSGYRRGFWRGLISLGVTAVSAGLSLLVSKLLAGTAAGLVMPLIPLEAMDLPFPGEFTANLLQGLIGVVISLMIFSSLLLMFCLIGKTLSNYLGDDKMMPKNTGMKWAGLGIRLVDAVVFSLLLVLPLYGTLATYTPVVKTVIEVSGEDLREIQEPLEIIEEHPVVTATKDGPMGLVYGGLAEALVGESTMNIAGMADSVSGLMEKVEALDSASEEEVLPRTLELIEYLRTDVVDEAWCYELVIHQLLPEFKTTILENEHINEEWINRFFDLCDMSQKDFRTNAHAILDFAEATQGNDVLDMDLEALMESEMYLEQIGKLINASDQAVGLKNLMIRGVAAECLYNNDWDAAMTLPLNEKPVDRKDYQQDALAFILLMMSEDTKTFREALALQP